MLKRTALAAALAVALGVSHAAVAAESRELALLRVQIKELKDRYEQRITALEKRLQENDAAQAAKAAPVPTAGTTSPAVAEGMQVPGKAADASSNPYPLAATQDGAAPGASAGASAGANSAAGVIAGNTAGGASGFNPSVSLILGGTYANLSQDPRRYRLQGFLPGAGEIGPGRRGFNLGESELTLAASIDPQFAGQLTFSLTRDNSVSVEEAFFQTSALARGVSLKAGRFLSSVGYLNGQHAHTWDFVDAPLAYQAFFGGQYKPDGVQLRWLAPTDRFVELGLELGSGASFSDGERNRNGVGATALFAHVGDDIGEAASYRAGLSYLHAGAVQRRFDGVDAAGAGVTDGFTGNSGTWIADAVYKWSPNGNPVQTNFKLQAEYFRRTERGELGHDIASSTGGSRDRYRSAQNGWYLQGIYQFSAGWRAGVRYDRLDSGNRPFGAALDAADFPQLAAFRPRRATAMLDYSPSEFSRFRLQYARDQSRPDASDNQIFLQYIMSLGAHGAHTF